MFVLVGFAVGYMIGAKQGQEGLERLLASVDHVRKSDEFAAAVETGRNLVVSSLHQALQMGKGMVSGDSGSGGGRLRVA